MKDLPIPRILYRPGLPGSRRREVVRRARPAHEPAVADHEMRQTVCTRSFCPGPFPALLMVIDSRPTSYPADYHGYTCIHDVTESKLDQVLKQVQNQRRATILALVAVGLWSTVATAFKLSLRHLDPFQLVAYATLCATLVLILGGWMKGYLHALWPYFRQQPLLFLALGLLNPFVYYLILFQAYELLPAQQAQSINYTWAITLGLLSVPLLKRPYGVRDGLGALLGYSGVLIIATRGDLLSFKLDSPGGVALALLSTLVWAMYWLLNTRMDAGPLPGISVCFLCGLPFTLVACAMFSDLTSVNTSGLLGAAYVGLFEMGITFVIWLMALKTARNIAMISNLIFLSPFLSLIPISMILNENIVPATIAGLALIMTGTLVQQLWRGNR